MTPEETLGQQLEHLAEALLRLHQMTQEQTMAVRAGETGEVAAGASERQMMFTQVVSDWESLLAQGGFADASLFQETRLKVKTAAERYLQSEADFRATVEQVMAERLPALTEHKKRQLTRTSYQETLQKQTPAAKLFPGNARFFDDSR